MFRSSKQSVLRPLCYVIRIIFKKMLKQQKQEQEQSSQQKKEERTPQKSQDEAKTK